MNKNIRKVFFYTSSQFKMALKDVQKKIREQLKGTTYRIGECKEEKVFYK